MAHLDYLLASLLIIGLGCHRDDGTEGSPSGGPTPTAAPGSTTATANTDAASVPPRLAPVVDAARPPPVDAAVHSDAAIESAKRLGKHGEVCALGSRHARATDDPYATGREPKITPVECGPGLQCCYPCGIQGCDSVCHTPQECNLDRQRP